MFTYDKGAGRVIRLKHGNSDVYCHMYISIMSEISFADFINGWPLRLFTKMECSTGASLLLHTNTLGYVVNICLFKIRHDLHVRFTIFFLFLAGKPLLFLQFQVRLTSKKKCLLVMFETRHWAFNPILSLIKKTDNQKFTYFDFCLICTRMCAWILRTHFAH